MCELLALSSALPARLSLSLEALAAHGASGGVAPDGWGVAFYEGPDVALFREPAPAGDSPLVRQLQAGGPATQLAISHIRRATLGGISLANTQPFVRELGGRAHVFAHNGHLPGVETLARREAGVHQPIGQTDSEHAFCLLLARLRVLWDVAGDGSPPPLAARLDLIADFAAQLRSLGPANFLYADGDTLFAHGHRRIQRTSGQIEPPGLWVLQRHCGAPEAPTLPAGLSVAPSAQDVVLVASVPLSTEAWRPFPEGEILALRAGAVVASRV